MNFDSGRYGMLSVCFGKPGKSNAARRTLPMTARVRCILEARHVKAGSPDPSGWLFPTSNSKSGHITHSTLTFDAEEGALSGPEGLEGRALRALLATALLRNAHRTVTAYGCMDFV
jgi:hypothetical protein